MLIKIAIMMNNYFHDLATALFVTSGVAIYYLAVTAEGTKDREVIKYFVQSYRRLTLLGRGAFVWIIAAGTIRLANFKDFEWVDAIGKNQVPALIVKHVLIFTFVGLGVYSWRKLNNKVGDLQKTYAFKEDASSGKGGRVASTTAAG